jgi:cytochrome c-type biogenesis protein CcmH
MNRLRRALFAITLAAPGLLACNKDKEAVPPSGVPALAPGSAESAAPMHPPLGNAAAPPSGALPSGHPSLPAGHPQVGAEGTPGAGGGAFEGRMPGGEYDPKESITGQIALAPALKDKVAPGDAIFLSARQDDGSEHGTLLGAKRFSPGAWPIAFELDGRDAMFPGTKLAGKVLLTVRVDKDGDAMSKLPGDLVGTAHIEVPAHDVRLTVDKVAQ